MSDLTHTNSMMDEIRELLLNARQRVAVQVNTELLSTYWNVGRIIVEHEQENNKRQISTSLYERLLLSEGKTNKETVLALAEKGIEMSTPLDIIKDPYVFEFLGMPENKPMLESDLEKAIVIQIEKFLLELGRGFMFVGTQQRITLNNTHYYAAEVNDEHDNPPIGIILCTDKDSIAAEYALGGLSNNIFASRYVSYIPNKEQLIAQVEAVLNEWNKPEKGD